VQTIVELWYINHVLCALGSSHFREWETSLEWCVCPVCQSWPAGDWKG